MADDNPRVRSFCLTVWRPCNINGGLSCARDAAWYVHPKLSATAVKVEEKRDRFDWSREELIAIIEKGRVRGNGIAGANECDDEPDQVH